MKPTLETLKAAIKASLCSEITTQHTDTSHYYVYEGATYSSISAKLKLIKSFDHVDPSVLHDAGQVGTLVHGAAERYFNEWLLRGFKPVEPVRDYLNDSMGDIRAISATRALQSFVDDYNYVPAAVELPLASHRLELAGCADAVGMINCSDGMGDLVLIDLKTSAALDETFWIQLHAYATMFEELVGIKLKHLLLVKLSKKDGTYVLEHVKRTPAKMAFKALMDLNKRLTAIQDARSPKVVLTYKVS